MVVCAALASSVPLAAQAGEVPETMLVGIIGTPILSAGSLVTTIGAGVADFDRTWQISAYTMGSVTLAWTTALFIADIVIEPRNFIYSTTYWPYGLVTGALSIGLGAFNQGKREPSSSAQSGVRASPTAQPSVTFSGVF